MFFVRPSLPSLAGQQKWSLNDDRRCACKVAQRSVLNHIGNYFCACCAVFAGTLAGFAGALAGFFVSSISSNLISDACFFATAVLNLTVMFNGFTP